MSFNIKEHMSMALQGILLFSINFLLFYYGSVYLLSGIVAVIAASIIIMNILNSKIFLKRPLVSHVVMGALFGLLGLTIIFSSEISLSAATIEDRTQMLIGLVLCLMGTYMASLGQIVSYKNQMAKLPILQTTTYSVFYGTICTLLFALCLGQKPSFEYSFAYISSLLYLSIIGTVIAVTLYLTLLGRLGTERAAYAFVIIPVISLSLSSLFEDFQWHYGIFFGLVLILFGNFLVLRKSS